jgi:alkylation response protein AidB-like acyl-CoA dehydrogenase
MGMMLTIQELSGVRDKLRSMRITIESLRLLFLSSGHSEDARRLNDVVGLVDDEIAALEKETG